jgi:F-type H+-transporting ATPase subunit b
MFFKPIQKVLHQRYEQTEGARKLAEESLQRAASKAAEYEAALRVARGEVYHAQEQLHKQLQEQHSAQIAEARRGAEAAVQQARQEIAQDVEGAKAGLQHDSEALADQIAESILRRRAA